MSERKILFLLGAVQFINVVEFMMVVPLGPDFAAGLDISTAKLGLVAGSYTAAAAVAGLIAALFLDRFDRRRALFCAMLGLVAGTAAGGLAEGLGSMVAARVLAGCFGGPASALSMAILADLIPPERRGKAMGAVAGAVAIASTLGVPFALRLALIGGWRLPFFVVAGLGLVVASAAIALMPPMRKHLDMPKGELIAARPLGVFLRDPAVLYSLASMGVLMSSVFGLVANLFGYLQFNLGYPRSRIDVLYMAGGIVTFFSMRGAGLLADKKGSVAVSLYGTALATFGIAALFLPARPLVSVVLLFVILFIANSSRMIALNALTSRVPHPSERARYMSAQSAVQHIATSLGAIGSTAVLSERSDRSLAGMPTLAGVAIALTLLFPVLLAQVARLVRKPAAAR